MTEGIGTMDVDPNTRFIQELAFHGLMFGNEASAVEDGLGEDVERYIADPTAPAASGIDLHEMFPDLNAREVCLALIAGARHAAAKAREIEVAAAQFARQLRPAVTVRELANAAGITERAGTTRYPNPLAWTPPRARKGGGPKHDPPVPAPVSATVLAEVQGFDLEANRSNCDNAETGEGR
ncbi:hypothetical protein [Mycobacterium hubeiense]|uniref:hypothetical protein n=1 Tax=Mycobacterium hubeiense TaxID=1867256 RepID=UPI000C7EED29|nr:hypothetical protein [Mycobacterium sp. QGD 101]